MESEGSRVVTGQGAIWMSARVCSDHVRTAIALCPWPGTLLANQRRKNDANRAAPCASSVSDAAKHQRR